MSVLYDDLGIDLERHVGFDFSHYDPARLPKLPPEEEGKWYAKYYYQGRPRLSEETLRCVQPGVQMDPARALLPGNADALMEPGLVEGDEGYCLLPNGAGYASTHTVLPDVTPEMNGWYKRLRLVDKLAYVIWYPGSHYSEVNGTCMEDIGFGLESFDVVCPVNAKNMGFHCHPADQDPQFLGLIGGNGWWHNLDHPEIRPRAMALFHYIRKRPEGGLDLRTHLYMGMFALNGEGVLQQHIRPDICLEATRRMAEHCVYERNHLNNFLPALYEAMKDMDLTPKGEVKESWAMETAPI